MNYNQLVRRTTSICPECFKFTPANIIVTNQKIFLVKTCPDHGDFNLLLSDNPKYYLALNKIYFSLFKHSLPQKEFIVHVTNKCNLNCPICMTDSNSVYYKGEFPVSKLKDFLTNKEGYKIDLMGAEPTMRKDLTEFIRLVKTTGNISALHTNGMKFADFQYLKKLKDAGLNEIHFQFDSFNDEVYKKIRGAKLLKVKLEALYNIRKLSIPTDLKVTVLRGVNDNELGEILKFGLQYNHIKEIFFLGCRYLGRAKKHEFKYCLMPDKLIDLLENQTGGKISRQDFLLFHKIYYRILSIFSIRKCFYNQHLLLFRFGEGKNYIPFTYLLSWRNYLSGRVFFTTNYVLRFLYAVICIFFKEGLFSIVSTLRNFNLSKIPENFLLIGCISACDVYSFDSDIARNCGKGAISIQRGVEPSGALDNIRRDCSINIKNEYTRTYK